VDKSSEKTQPRAAKKEGDTPSLSDVGSVVRDKSTASTKSAKQQKTDVDASTGGGGESKRRFSSLFKKRRNVSESRNAQPAETITKRASAAVCDGAKPQTTAATKGSIRNPDEKKTAHLKAVSTKREGKSSAKTQPQAAKQEGDTPSLSDGGSVVRDKSTASPESAKQQKTDVDVITSVSAKQVDKSSEKTQPRAAKKEGDTPSLSDVGSVVRDKSTASTKSAKQQKTDVDASTGGGGESKRRFSSLFKKRRNVSESRNAQPAETPTKRASTAVCDGAKPQTKAEDKVAPVSTASTAAPAQSKIANRPKIAKDAQKQVLKSKVTKNKPVNDQPASISAKDPSNADTMTAKEATPVNSAGNLAPAKEEQSLESTETISIDERELKNAIDESIEQKNSTKSLGGKSKIGTISLKLKQKKVAKAGPPPSSSSSNDKAATKPAETRSGGGGAKDGVVSKGNLGANNRAVPLTGSSASESTAEEKSRRKPGTKASSVSSAVESDIEKGEPRSFWSVASAVSSMFSSNGGSESKPSIVGKKTASDGVEDESVASVHDDEGISGASEFVPSLSTVSKESLRTEVEYVLDGASPNPNEDTEHLRETKKSQSVAPSLSINTSALVGMVSNAIPLSALSPINKEEMEVQLQPKEDETLTEINQSKSVSEEFSKRLEETTNQINQLKDELLALALSGDRNHTAGASDAKGGETGGPERDNEFAEVEMKRKTSLTKLLPGRRVRGGKFDEGSSSMSKVRPPQIMKKGHPKKKMPRVLGSRNRGGNPVPNKHKDSREVLGPIRRVKDADDRVDGVNGLALGDGSDDDEEIIQNEENRMDVMNGKRSKPRGFMRKEPKREATSIVKGPMKSPVMHRTPRRREEDTSCGGSLAMKSTLSNAEFLSVQSSITTDQEAFKCKPNKSVADGALNGPNIIKRTGSLVKNPALAIRANSRGLAAREEMNLERHVKQGKNAARVHSRKKESWSEKVNENYFKSYNHPRVDLDSKEENLYDHDEVTSSSTSAKSEIGATPCQDNSSSAAFDPPDEDEDVKETSQAEDAKETNQAVQSSIDPAPDTTLVKKTLHVPLIEDTREISYAVSMGESMYVDNLTSKVTHKPPLQTVPVPDQRVQKVHFRGVDLSQKSDQATGNNSVLVEENGDEFIVRETPPISVVRTLAREKRVRAKVSNPPAETQLRRVASNNIATQTNIEVPRVSSELHRVPSHVAPQQYAAKESSGSGSLANVFESVALCSANMCMGSGRAMMACADTCSDSPNGCSRKYEVADETNYAASQNILYNTQRIGTQQADCIFRTPNTSVDDAEKVAEGIYTKALTLAIQQQLSGQLTVEEQSTRSRELPHRGVWGDTGSIESGFVPASNLKQKRVEDYESIDGRCVPVSRLKRDKYSNVPMNIDVRGKSREIHDNKQTNQERPGEIKDVQRAQPGIMENDQVIEQLNSRIANLEGRESKDVQAPQTGVRSPKQTGPDNKRSKSPRGKDPPRKGGLRKLLKLPKISVMYEV